MILCSSLEGACFKEQLPFKCWTATRRNTTSCIAYVLLLPYREAEGHDHGAGSNTGRALRVAKSQVLTGVSLVLCLALLQLGGQEPQHAVLQPGGDLPHPGHAWGLLFLSSRLGCHRATRIPLHSESQSHFPTSSSTAKFLHFPSCLSQRPSCPLTLPPLAFFLPLDRPHPTHTHFQKSTHPRLPTFFPP